MSERAGSPSNPVSGRQAAGEGVVRDMFGESFLQEKLAGPAAAPGSGGDLARLALEQCYGDIWTRPGLDRRARSLVTLGILIAAGQPAELRNHVLGALGNGLTPEEILEVPLQAAPYVGFPAAGQAYATVATVLAEVQGAGDRDPGIIGS